jgi:hypothetical protein
MTGENNKFVVHAAEITDFPDIGKRMLRLGSEIEIFDAADAKPFGVKIET